MLGLLRTPAATMMTVLVIAIALLLPGILRQLEDNLVPVAASAQDSARITLFLFADVTEQNGLQLSKDLLERYSSISVRYLSSTAALAEFRANSGLDRVIDQLNRNPLPASITVVPQFQFTAEVESLASDLANLPEVETIRVDLAWIERLSALRELVMQLRILLAAILSLAVLLIIGNTIRMSIENRRSEIDVLKLVGGTPGYIARPFLYCGLLLGAAGGLIAGLLLLGAQALISAPIDTLLSLYGGGIVVQWPGLADLLISLVTGALLGWFGALVSVLQRLYAAPA